MNFSILTKYGFYVPKCQNLRIDIQIYDNNIHVTWWRLLHNVFQEKPNIMWLDVLWSIFPIVKNYGFRIDILRSLDSLINIFKFEYTLSASQYKGVLTLLHKEGEREDININTILCKFVSTIFIPPFWLKKFGVKINLLIHYRVNVVLVITVCRFNDWKNFQIRIYFKRITVQGGLDFIT
jgi:hypothetical protein